MKNKILLMFLGLILSTQIFGQQGVSITTDNSPPDESAMLDIKSNDKGILIPRVALLSPTQPINNPTEGLLVYNNDATMYPIGFYYWTGTVWNQFTTQGTVELSLSGNTLSVTGGNSVDLSGYLDNTDNQTLNISGNEISISDGNNVYIPTILQSIQITSSNEQFIQPSEYQVCIEKNITLSNQANKVMISFNTDLWFGGSASGFYYIGIFRNDELIKENHFNRYISTENYKSFTTSLQFIDTPNSSEINYSIKIRTTAEGEVAVNRYSKINGTVLILQEIAE